MNVHASPLLHLTTEARRPTTWWLAWLFVMVVAVVVAPVAGTIGNTLLGDPGPDDPSFPWVDAFGAAATLLALYLWVRLKERRPFSSLGFRPRRDGARVLLGLAIGAALVTVPVLVGLSTGLYAVQPSPPVRTGTSAVLPLLALLPVVLLQAVAQESLTRGYLVPMSLRQMPAWLAVVSTSALVAVLHSLNVVTLANAFLYATFATLVALQQGSLWLAVGVHAAWSSVQTSIFGLPVGGVTDGAALWSIGPAPDGGGALVNGGLFGLETGLLATAVLVVAAVTAAVRLTTTGRTSATALPTPALPSTPHTTSRTDQTDVARHH